jgi:hypothetical protein
MTALYLLLSLLSASAFYLASPHQRLSTRLAAHRTPVRIAAWLSAGFAIIAAIASLGVWAGLFSALTAWMLYTVLLPYLDAWHRTRKGDSHVG